MLDRRSGPKSLNVLRPIWQWTQAKFARQLPWRAFVSGQAYYAGYLRTDASRALIHHTGPYVGTPNHQTELIEGMLAGQGPAIVCAPPGCGKSRFALELARRIERAHPRWQVVFVRHDEVVVREELPQLTQLRHVIFLVDDAQECPELVELLAAACAQTSAAAPLHLLCLTRPTGRARVRRALDSAVPPGAIQEVDLGRPSLQLVRTLIDQLLPQSSPHHRDTIARFVRQSYFGAVLVCSLLRRDAKLPQTFQRQDLRDRIRREPLREAADGVCPTEAALHALAVYAALSPVPRARADVREWAAELSGLTPETVGALTDRMIETGLFQESGGAIRPLPDLLGDLILEEACLDAHDRPTPFSARLLEALLAAEPVATVRNCASVGQLFGTGQDLDLVSNLVLERARTIPAGNPWDALKLLRTAQPLAACRPATVVELARIMAARDILRRDPSAAGLLSTDNVEMATCELLMSAGEVDPTAVPVALGLGRELYAVSQEDLRARDHVLGRLKAYCRLETGRSLAHAQAVVDTLRSWVSEPDAETAALSASLNAQFITLEVSGQVAAVRDVAIGSLTRAMAHEHTVVQCAAIQSLGRYVEGHGPSDPARPDRWLPQLTQEAERLSAALIKLAKENSRLPVSAAAELQGWHWWSQPQDALQRAGLAILQAVPDTDAYRLWKLLYEPRLPVRTTLPEPMPQRPEDRLQFVQALGEARGQDTLGQARQLFDSLDPRYPDTAWRALWLSVLEESAQAPIDHHTDVIAGEFVRRHPEVAWSFVNRTDADGPLFAVLPFLLVELGKLDRARRAEEARGVLPGTCLEEAWLRALSLASDLGEPERTILARGLASADPHTAHRAAAALLATGSAERATAFRKVFGMIAHRPADSRLWELVLERFVSWADGALPTPPGKPTEEAAQVAGELISLLRTYGSHLRWGFQRHTHPLSDALAIIAVLCPRRLQDWMQREWGQPEPAGGRWSDESPLSVDRLPEIMRSIADSPAAGQWIETFLDWVKRSPKLAGIGALGLAELCSLDDPRVGELADAIRARPTEPAKKALADFVNQRKRRERPSSSAPNQ